MAVSAKYSPNPMNWNIVPKEWMNTPIMSFEEALMEQEKLQQAELANSIAEQNAERLTRQNESEKELAKQYEQELELRRQAGEESPLISTEDTIKMVNENRLKYGQGDTYIDDAYKQMQLESAKEERDRKAKEINLRTGMGGEIWYQDPETNKPVIVRAAKEPKEGGKSKFPEEGKVLLNEETGATTRVYSPGEEAEARGSGYTMKVSGTVSQADLAARRQFPQYAPPPTPSWNQMRSNPSGGKVKLEENIRKGGDIDFKAPPGSKVLQKGNTLQVTYPDGRQEEIDLKTNKRK